MDPFGFVKSAREAYNVTPWWVSFPVIGVAFLIVLATAGKAVQEIAGWRPKRWWVSVRRAVVAVAELAVRLQLRSPIFLRSLSRSDTSTAIAFPMTISMAYENGAVSVFCSIAIYALTQTKESPTEVALLLPNGEEICRVEFHPGYQPQISEPGVWRVMKYVGTIPAANLEKLTRAVRHTRTQATVEVGLLIPGGSAGAVHHESGVQFWLPEVDGRGAPLAGSPRLTAIIDGWRREWA